MLKSCHKTFGVAMDEDLVKVVNTLLKRGRVTVSELALTDAILQTYEDNEGAVGLVSRQTQCFDIAELSRQT